jgi:hypothetical protein
LLATVEGGVGKKLTAIFSGGSGAKEEAPVAEAAPAAAEPAAKEVAEEAPKPTKGRKAKKVAAAEESEKPAAASEADSTVSETAAVESAPSSQKRLDLAIGAHVYGRNFTYNDSRAGKQQAYHLPAVPAPSLSLDYYVVPFLALTVGGEYSVALISEDSGGNRYKTSSLGYFAGVKGRYLMGSSELTAGLAYAANSFKVTPEAGDQTPPEVAGVDYKQIRAGVGARIALGSVALIGGGNYLHLLGIGELHDKYFPFSTGRGGEGFAGVAFGLPWMSGLEARITADLRRYVFAMNSAQSDLEPKGPGRIAGGATDQYVGVNIAFGYRQ